MTRSHRTRHLITWLILPPLCIAAVLLALAVREPRHIATPANPDPRAGAAP